MKLWQKNTSLNKQVETFTVGKDRELDIWLAPYDVIGSMAHATMLEKVGLLTEEEKDTLLSGLKTILTEIENGKFEIADGVEDVHSQVEFLLTERLGDVGKKLHMGRSRNDQVLLDLKMFFRAEIWELAKHIEQLSDTLIAQSNKFKDVLMPGYTHMQVAMPSSFGLWFGAYAESLVDDLVVLHGAYEVSNRNPLGSAAGYGASFPLDRKMTTELLGFDDLSWNVVYAQMGRGKTELIIANAIATVATTLSKLAMDTCMFAGQNFGFFKFPDELTTGSSIMPHKKNPDVMELVRAKCHQLAALPAQVLAITAGLPSGYHRDFQQVKEVLLPAFGMLHDCLEMTRMMMESAEVNPDLLSAPIYDYLFSVEDVNNLVLQGIPFRDAYKQVGMMIEEGKYTPSRKVNHTHEGSIGNLCNDKINAKTTQALERFGYTKIEKILTALQK
ncbi:argininosuccinate lyase [Limibacter armeniacum]|uniref:argininosuccinate lyase n=1 Tax=Limibacter armeniacum TaxID=466084 RepID=UPI002FE5BA4C